MDRSTSEYYLGIMSGTSLDGIDLALVDMHHPETPVVCAHREFPFPVALRDTVWELQDGRLALSRLVALNNVLGSVYADHVHRFLEEINEPADRVRAVGFHGATVMHVPDAETVAEGSAGRGTLQLGDPHMIRALTGIPVISDFRHADMAAGGQGAPLAPFIDHLIFRDQQQTRVLINLGGIANLTVLPPLGDQPRFPVAHEGVIAFDSGPANIIIDQLMRRHPQTPAECDRDGMVAAKGKVLNDLLNRCLAHPYFRRTPPKSTGRELFGAAFTREFFGHADDYNDLVTTATCLTATTVADAIRMVTDTPPGEVIVSGGGAYNPALMGMLAEKLPDGSELKRTSDYGFDESAKEAVLMATLAWAFTHRVPAGFPSVTGANRSAVLGVLIP